MSFNESGGHAVGADVKYKGIKDIVAYSHNGETIALRATDGYINATAMCKAAGKDWSNYRKNAETEEFLKALEMSLRIRRDLLIQTISGGPNSGRGTWVHPQLAINLATWLSPEFAVQVSEWVVAWMMEIADRKPAYPDFSNISEDEKRLYLRDQVTSSNKKLASAARSAGVITGSDFSVFQSFGYQGMYGGRNVSKIRQAKGLPTKAAILDHMGSAELAANLFRITQTEEKLINEGISHKAAANNAHYQVGERVRKAMLEISGVTPENLPVAPDVKKLQKQLQKQSISSPKAENKSSSIQFNSDDIAEIEGNKTPFDNKVINLRDDLWKYTILIAATKPDGFITTSELIDEFPNYITVPEDTKEILKGRNDSKFSQLVRNLKSHKASKTNFIYQGYAEDVKGGFKVTDKGIAFIKEYFSE
ncbi:KilA-N domain-containing protein [Bartonella sp. LJL80]